MDLILSLCALVALSPVLFITALLVRLKLGSPIIFTQKRPGKNGIIFTLYKFRSMTDARDGSGELLSDELRLTKFGRMLRSTSLDELPELFNILKGDMSIVGPRPLLLQYLNYYTEKEKHRHDVCPGLTGLAQVSGRNFLKWEARLAKDVEYVNNITFLKDVKIILKTGLKVIKRLDISTNTGEVEGNLAEIRSTSNKITYDI